MMNAHQLVHLASLSGRPARPLAAGHAMALGTSGGRLQVIAGRVWLTREGELDDDVVAAGESRCIAPSGEAVIEAWDKERPALVTWRPRPPIERVGEAWQAARALALRLFLHNAGNAAGAPHERASRPAQKARRCPPGAA